MSDEATLTRAMRALRESTDGSHASASRTRTQILVRVQQRARRRRRTALVLMPLAAAFIASAAWGAVTGRLSAWLHGVAGHEETQRTQVLRPYGGELQAISPPTPSASVSPPRANETLPSPSVVPAPPVASTPKVSLPASTLSRPARPAAPSVSSREQSLYVAAHSAHFVDQDPAAALRGWDAYLAEYPNGHFSLEARYNRAICLVRLARRDDARAALTPFANGDYAGYRQHEARELLDALVAADGGAATK